MIGIQRCEGLGGLYGGADRRHEGPVAHLFSTPVAGRLGERLVVSATRGVRLMLPGQPPLYFLPPSALARRHLRASDTLRVDEFGLAVHLHLAAGGRLARDVAWYYPGPDPEYALIAGMVCIDPARLDQLLVDGQAVTAAAAPGAWLVPVRQEGGWRTAAAPGGAGLPANQVLSRRMLP